MLIITFFNKNRNKKNKKKWEAGVRCIELVVLFLRFIKYDNVIHWKYSNKSSNIGTQESFQLSQRFVYSQVRGWGPGEGEVI